MESSFSWISSICIFHTTMYLGRQWHILPPASCLPTPATSPYVSLCTYYIYVSPGCRLQAAQLFALPKDYLLVVSLLYHSSILLPIGMPILSLLGRQRPSTLKRPDVPTRRTEENASSYHMMLPCSIGMDGRRRRQKALGRPCSTLLDYYSAMLPVGVRSRCCCG